MIGFIACVLLWLGMAFFGVARRLRWLALGLLWALITLASWPGSPLGGLAQVFGGDFRLWVLLGPLALVVMLYRRLLVQLRAAGRRRAGLDAAAVVPEPEAKGQLSPAEIDRYSRHILLREIGGPGQQRLHQARVLVVGAGGLGAPVLMELAASGLGALTVIDPDRVEASNLQRQFIHMHDAIGQPKAQSARDTLARLNPGVRVTALVARLDDDEAARALIAEHDLVLDGCDNFATRHILNRLCAEAGVPLIQGALTQWEGEVALWDPRRGGPCYACVFPEAPAADLVAPCALAGVAGPLPGIIGSVMAMEAVKHLTGAGEGLRGRLMLHDALHAETRMIRTRARPDCPVCAGLQPSQQ